MREKLIINVAVTGMVPTKAQTPHVPIAPKEIADCALSCAASGAAVVHIHAREADGTPTWRKEVFAEIIERIRRKNKDLIISVTTSGRLWNEFDKRSEVLQLEGHLKPDLASLTVGSMNFIRTASVNDPQMIMDLASMMQQKGIKPELEIFEPGMINAAKYLMKKGIISTQKPYWNLLLGSLGTSPLDASCLAAMLTQLPADSVWSLAGIGDYQLDANMTGLALGGHVRVGLEDHIYFDRQRQVLATNETMVKRISQVAKLSGITVATPQEARLMLGLS